MNIILFDMTWIFYDLGIFRWKYSRNQIHHRVSLNLTFLSIFHSNLWLALVALFWLSSFWISEWIYTCLCRSFVTDNNCFYFSLIPLFPVDDRLSFLKDWYNFYNTGRYSWLVSLYCLLLWMPFRTTCLSHQSPFVSLFLLSFQNLP